MPHRTVKITLLHHFLPPYRVPVFDKIGEASELKVFISGSEDNRRTWDNVLHGDEHFSVATSWGFRLTKAKKRDGKVIDKAYVFINPGFFWDLVRTRPDVVISYEMGFRTLMALTFGSLFRRPVWVWWGGTIHSVKAHNWLRHFIRKAFVHWIRNWISYGETSTEYLMSIGVRREQILQTQCCVDNRLFSPDKPPLFPDLKKPVLLHSGQIIKRKGCDLFFRAAKKAQETGREFTILMVGGGEEKEHLQQLEKELDLKNVVWARECRPEEMPGVYTSADAVIFPTIEDVWGLVANEAILSGVPVLCSKYAGCYKELIPPGNVIDPYDIDDFAAKLCDTIDGKLEKTDPATVLSAQTVGQMMIDDIAEKCRFRFVDGKLVKPRKKKDDTVLSSIASIMFAIKKQALLAVIIRIAFEVHQAFKHRGY